MYNDIYQSQRTLYLKGRPVASIEEVRAIPIDFDGSTFFFPDLANKKIYTKQINMDGTASLNMYELKEIPVEKNSGYITREEFEKAIAELRAVVNVPVEPAVPQKPKIVVDPNFEF